MGSHNAFEETLMERGRYPVLDAHAQVHEAFKRRALSYDKRLKQGEEPVRVAREVRSDIGLWLTNHIQRDDKDYIPFVRRAIEGEEKKRKKQKKQRENIKKTNRTKKKTKNDKKKQ